MLIRWSYFMSTQPCGFNVTVCPWLPFSTGVLPLSFSGTPHYLLALLTLYFQSFWFYCFHPSSNWTCSSLTNLKKNTHKTPPSNLLFHPALIRILLFTVKPLESIVYAHYLHFLSSYSLLNLFQPCFYHRCSPKSSPWEVINDMHVTKPNAVFFIFLLLDPTGVLRQFTTPLLLKHSFVILLVFLLFFTFPSSFLPPGLK